MKPSKNDCPANKTFGGVHEFRVLGTPHSAMTYYECRLCGLKKERGPGLFYRGPSAHKDIAP